MTDHSFLCYRRLRQALPEILLRSLGQDSGFCKRERKLTAFRAVWTFAAAMASGTTRTIADIVRLFTALTDDVIAYKAFHVPLANAAFPEFMRQVVERLMSKLLDPIVAANSSLLAGFEDIVIHDGSSFAVDDALYESFPGRFTTISPGAVELHCTYSLFEGQPQAIAIAPDKEAERQFLPPPEELAGKLILLDRGYVWYEYFRAVKLAGGQFIARARDNRYNPKILKCYRGLPDSAVGKRLAEIELPQCNADLLVEGTAWKGERHVFRLVLFYVPRKKRHLRLITSLNPREYRPTKIAELYRLRWQVELLFKECKSFTCLRKFQTKDPRIVEGLIWATLIAVLLRRFLLYSAFRDSGERPSVLVAAAMSWTFFRDLARAALDSRRLPSELKRILLLLRTLAERTNPRRLCSFKRLSIDPALDYA